MHSRHSLCYTQLIAKDIHVGGSNSININLLEKVRRKIKKCYFLYDEEGEFSLCYIHLIAKDVRVGGSSSININLLEKVRMKIKKCYFVYDEEGDFSTDKEDEYIADSFP